MAYIQAANRTTLASTLQLGFSRATFDKAVEKGVCEAGIRPARICKRNPQVSKPTDCGLGPRGLCGYQIWQKPPHMKAPNAPGAPKPISSRTLAWQPLVSPACRDHRFSTPSATERISRLHVLYSSMPQSPPAPTGRPWSTPPTPSYACKRPSCPPTSCRLRRECG